VIPRNGQPPDPSLLTIAVVLIAVVAVAYDSLRRCGGWIPRRR